jgi:hypothetical protein
MVRGQRNERSSSRGSQKADRAAIAQQRDDGGENPLYDGLQDDIEQRRLDVPASDGRIVRQQKIEVTL